MTPHQSSSETNEAVIRRVYAEIVNHGQFDLIDELYRPDVVDHDPFPGAPDGREGVRFTLGRLRQMYSDVEVTIEHLTAHDDKVTLRSTMRGTFARGLRGTPSTDRRVEYDAVVVFRLKDGLIAERWATLTIDRLLDQLGVDAADVRSSRIEVDVSGDKSTSMLRALGELLTKSSAGT